MTAVEHDNDQGIIGQLVAKIGLMVTVGEQTRDQTARVAKKLDAYRAQQPVDFRAIGSAIADANGVAVIQFSPAGPDQGHKWELQNVVLGGDTFATTAASATVEYYASAMDLRTLLDTSPPLTDCVDATSNALPFPAFYSRGQFTLRPGEKLYVRITGATEGQQYVGVARGLDIQEAANQQVTGI